MNSETDSTATSAITQTGISDSTAEVVLDEGAVRRLDQRIRLVAGSVWENFVKLADLVHEAKTGKVHTALGFPSWTAYLADALGEQPLLLDRDHRRELVGFLSSEGMSTRAIAAVAGTSQRTVVRELGSGESNDSPAGRMVTGVDGKSYPPKPETKDEPAQRKRPRRPLPQAFGEHTNQVDKSVTSLMNLVGDDRFASNRDRLTWQTNGLKRAIAELQKIVAEIEGGQSA